MADNVRILLAACDCIHIDTARLKLILQVKEYFKYLHFYLLNNINNLIGSLDS